MNLVQTSLLDEKWEQEEFRRQISPAEKLINFDPVKLGNKTRCADCGRGMSKYIVIGQNYYHYDVLECAAAFTAGSIEQDENDQCSREVEEWYVGGIGLDKVLVSSIDPEMFGKINGGGLS